jgi:hypothetical protein
MGVPHFSQVGTPSTGAVTCLPQDGQNGRPATRGVPHSGHVLGPAETDRLWADDCELSERFMSEAAEAFGERPKAIPQSPQNGDASSFSRPQ